MRLACALAAVVLAAPPGIARAFDPAKDSPFTLLAVPDDGIGYLRDRQAARQLWRDKRYAEAEPLFERLVREYPRDAWTWMTLARVKSRLGKHAEAARANERAGPLIGWDVEYPVGYRLAINKLAAGDRIGAMETLRWMIHDRHG